MKSAVEGQGVTGVVESGRGRFAAPLALRIEEISYEELLRYEPLYDRERMPVRFEADVDADWEYLDYRFHAAYADDGPAGFSGVARTRRTPGCSPASLYLRSSYTLEAFRNQGVWRALWAHKLREVERLGWVHEETEIWGLARAGDRRYERRGFRIEGSVFHRYKSEGEHYLLWLARWRDLMLHPGNRVRVNGHVRLHP